MKLTCFDQSNCFGYMKYTMELNIQCIYNQYANKYRQTDFSVYDPKKDLHKSYANDDDKFDSNRWKCQMKNKMLNKIIK